MSTEQEKKTYKWDPTDTFSFTGGEFGFLYHTLMEEKAKLLKRLDAIAIVENKLVEGITQGFVKEIPTED